MPGVKSVSWGEANKAKALDGLLAMETIRVSDEVAQVIANHVGSGCTVKAVHTLLTTLGKRNAKNIVGADQVTPTKHATTISAKSSAAKPGPKSGGGPGRKAANGTGSARKKVKTEKEDSPLIPDPVPSSPPETPIKARASTRKTKKRDFTSMAGTDEDNSEGDGAKRLEENSEPTDGEFVAKKEPSNNEDEAATDTA